MRIAVFARSLSRKPTGRGAVAQELLEEILRQPSPPEVDLFAGEDIGLPGCRFRPARGTGIFSDAWRIFRGIAREVQDLQADVFWGTTHFLPRGLPRGLPKVTTLLDLVWKDHPDTVRWPNRLASGWMEQGLHESSRIVCISEFTKSRLLSHWPDLGDRAEVVPLAANPRLKVPADPLAVLRSRFGLEGDFVLNVDTFEPRKNLRVLLEVMSKLPEVTFVHCGHVGWNVDRDLAYARSLPNVRLLGYVGEEELGALYAGCRAAVFPSVYEGFHLAPLDACMLGVPVLASDIPVHREVLQDGAVYFDVQRPAELEARIRTLLSDRGERERLAVSGKKRAASYSWARSAAQVLSVLRRAIDR
jgi:glycosyltransferase involved in cell wall biosynthesis